MAPCYPLPLHSWTFVMNPPTVSATALFALWIIFLYQPLDTMPLHPPGSMIDSIQLLTCSSAATATCRPWSLSTLALMRFWSEVLRSSASGWAPRRTPSASTG